MHTIICILELMNFMLFLIKFIKFKQRIKFKKFELHNYGLQCRTRRYATWFHLERAAEQKVCVSNTNCWHTCACLSRANSLPPLGCTELSLQLVCVVLIYNPKATTVTNFITARRYASSEYAIALCLCLSVCLSVCHKSVFYQKG